MKALAWIIVLFAVAVGVTLFARYNTGYVLLVIPPWRIEFSLNVLLVALAVAFAGAYAVLRATSATMRLPRQVREYRLARRREQARTSLLEALREYFAGRYGRAEKAAAVAMESGEQPQLAAVLAARSAHELRAWERRDQYLERAGGTDPGADIMRVVTEAELLLEQHRHQEALERLKALPRKHTAALRLELKAQQQAHNWERMAALAGELEKRGVFDATQAGQIRRYALAEDLKRKALDTQALEEAWRKVPQDERTNRRVAAAAAQCFISLGGCARAHGIIEAALAAEWDTELVGLYAECDGGDTVARIERAEGWLKQHPEDAALLLTLGKLCAQLELWGKAQSYLDASVAVEPTWSAHLSLARLHERLGNVEAARKSYRESLDLALAQLRTVTGGRRRMPL
ncbi:MAG TPA: heme biosynthesis protein HemY [Burkholderiales bacterium]|nr:heme biosynthesis protein HemY [Burkholderiales bacterium]